MPGQLGQNDIGERNEIFMVDGFNVDLQRQPDLRDVVGGLEAGTHTRPLFSST
jgi:hypothetical protein